MDLGTMEEFWIDVTAISGRRPSGSEVRARAHRSVASTPSLRRGDGRLTTGVSSEGAAEVLDRRVKGWIMARSIKVGLIGSVVGTELAKSEPPEQLCRVGVRWSGGGCLGHRARRRSEQAAVRARRCGSLEVTEGGDSSL